MMIERRKEDRSKKAETGIDKGAVMQETLSAENIGEQKEKAISRPANGWQKKEGERKENGRRG